VIGWIITAWLTMQGAGDRGPQLYLECQACHALEPGVNTPAGPTLHAVIGRSVAAERGFNYSPALRRFGQTARIWTRERIDHFLADPESAIPGTEMGYPGMRDPGDRQALIDWLEARGRPAGRP